MINVAATQNSANYLPVFLVEPPGEPRVCGVGALQPGPSLFPVHLQRTLELPVRVPRAIAPRLGITRDRLR